MRNSFRFSCILSCLLASAVLRAENPVYPALKSALNISEGKATELGLRFEKASIPVKGLKREYNFLWIADLHVIADDLSEAAPKDLHILESRRDKSFRNPNNGSTAFQLWQKLPDCLNASGADAILLGGDICDVGSLANIRVLKEGLQKLTIPYMYLRADHDICPWWLSEKRPAEVAELEESIDGNADLMVIEYEDLAVVGYNNGCYKMTAAALARFREIHAKGKPILLLIHVPLHSPVDAAFLEACTSRDGQKRDLTWGKGSYYAPDANTQAFLDLVLAKDSPVKAVVAGHLHFPWQGPLTDSARQFLFSPSFKGNIGLIQLTPQK